MAPPSGTAAAAAAANTPVSPGGGGRPVAGKQARLSGAQEGVEAVAGAAEGVSAEGAVPEARPGDCMVFVSAVPPPAHLPLLACEWGRRNLRRRYFRHNKT